MPVAFLLTDFFTEAVLPSTNLVPASAAPVIAPVATVANTSIAASFAFSSKPTELVATLLIGPREPDLAGEVLDLAADVFDFMDVFALVEDVADLPVEAFDGAGVFDLVADVPDLGVEAFDRAGVFDLVEGVADLAVEDFDRAGGFDLVEDAVDLVAEVVGLAEDFADFFADFLDADLLFDSPDVVDLLLLPAIYHHPLAVLWQRACQSGKSWNLSCLAGVCCGGVSNGYAGRSERSRTGRRSRIKSI